MVAIGIDQSITNTGVAILIGDKVKYFTVRLSSKLENYKRYAVIKKWIYYLIENYQTKDIYVEDAYFSRKVSYGTECKELLAVLRVFLYEQGIDKEPLSPNGILKSSWPKVLGLRSTKTELLNKLIEIGVKANHHEADAIGVLWGGLVREGKTEPSEMLRVSYERKLVLDYVSPKLKDIESIEEIKRCAL